MGDSAGCAGVIRYVTAPALANPPGGLSNHTTRAEFRDHRAAGPASSAIGDSMGSPEPDLRMHNMEQFHGDGSVATVKDHGGARVQLGTPWWGREVEPGAVAVRIEDSYDEAVRHTATAGLRRDDHN
ncbi:hypothetical protein FB384_004422 [Prauserella sediminis]|uniref:Uncharacterized protein n=1 Tax=Prauserella sediminis TaxID=577680 RepID=A0A839Y0I1_9PSEU|nr:hypothetical protein [Prauserella sediminis]